jgi:hypothetical protein
MPSGRRVHVLTVGTAVAMLACLSIGPTVTDAGAVAPKKNPSATKTKRRPSSKPGRETPAKPPVVTRTSTSTSIAPMTSVGVAAAEATTAQRIPPSDLVHRLALTKPHPEMTDASFELSYLRAAQLPSGALVRRPGESEIIAYWGNYATIGIAATIARNPDMESLGWSWLKWYAAHQDQSTGYVEDHVVVDGREVATGHHDSTDAYAGTYLVAVEAMYEATRCVDCLQQLGRSVSLAVTAIASTQDGDGLTWAQPAGRVKYLMDQAEVGAGLRSAERLAALLNDEPLRRRTRDMRRRHDHGLATMLHAGNGQTLWALAENDDVARRFELLSAKTFVDESRLYPDSLGPVFVAALVADVSPDYAAAAIDSYTQRWHRWTEDPDTWGFPVLVAWALANAGRSDEANSGAMKLHQLVVDGYRGNALTVGHVGQLLTMIA